MGRLVANKPVATNPISSMKGVSLVRGAGRRTLSDKVCDHGQVV